MFLELYHPITNEPINLFSDKVNELLSIGYNINDILTLSKKIPPRYNRNNVFTNDMLLNYIKHMDENDIKALCLTDKDAYSLYHGNYLWKLKIEDYTNDFLSEYDDCYYIGDCNYKEYKKVKFAIDNTNLLKNKNVKFYFTNENIKQFTWNIDFYDNDKYSVQTIEIKGININFTFWYTVPTSTANGHQHTYDSKKIKVIIFNIFYYFPSVKWDYM